ncbi:MAG: hypothetical protein KKC84_06965 [Candidatus Omnitrophica bacterium]|nr:hypothetical protein [Candidatus Omnitrophota bacterium]
MRFSFYVCIGLAGILFSAVACAQEDSWQSHKSTHFVILYRHAPEQFIKQLVDSAEDYYNRIADDLGFTRFNFWLWDNRAKIYIYDNAQEYKAHSGQPAWSAGYARIRQKAIYTFVSAQGFFDTILPHEMGHIIFREFVGFYNRAVPLWLDEAVASYQQKSRYLLDADVKVKNALRQGNFLSLSSLQSMMPKDEAHSTVELFYAESFSLLQFLMKEFGKDSFVLFCQNLRDKKDLDRALASAYPYSNLAALEEAWKTYLRTR